MSGKPDTLIKPRSNIRGKTASRRTRATALPTAPVRRLSVDAPGRQRCQTLPYAGCPSTHQGDDTGSSSTRDSNFVTNYGRRKSSTMSVSGHSPRPRAYLSTCSGPTIRSLTSTCQASTQEVPPRSFSHERGGHKEDEDEKLYKSES